MLSQMKNGEEIAQEVDYGGVLPSGDGTYQMWVSVDPDPQSKDVYLVLWSTLAPRESESILLTVKVISGPIILTIVLAGAGVLTWRRSRACTDQGFVQKMANRTGQVSP
ncbi:major histocompatibility complex class I-related protein precursor [Cricetulus griseus]|nr:major histocompatibility complex class I-related protein precursor [Cricetulus griseus]